MSAPLPSRPARRRTGFCSDERGASAVEFAMLCGPFLLLVLYILQIGIYYTTQSALDSGLIRSADDLRNKLNYAAAPVLPSAASLKASVASNAGGLIVNDGTLSVEIRPLTALAAGTVPVTDGTSDYGGKTSVLVLRAQSQVVAFAPNFSVLSKVTSTALVRRQGQ